MIIQMIPETEEERQKFIKKFSAEKIEHTGVKDMFIFGNKIDSDKDIVDFHEWTGTYRYLLSSLNYFYEIINDERRSHNIDRPTPIPNMISDTEEINEAVKSIKQGFKNGPKIFKKGNVNNPNVEPIDVGNLMEEVAKGIPNSRMPEEKQFDFPKNLDFLKSSTKLDSGIPDPPIPFKIPETIIKDRKNDKD